MGYTMAGFVLTLAVLCLMEERREKGSETMPILFATIGTSLAKFAGGAILAASVYLVSRSIKKTAEKPQVTTLFSWLLLAFISNVPV